MMLERIQDKINTRLTPEERCRLVDWLLNNFGWNDERKEKMSLFKKSVSLADTPQYPACIAQDACCKQEETETTMNTIATTFNAAVNVEEMAIRQQKYFLNRLDRANSDQKDILRKKFGLENDSEPNTFAELLARITAGKYIISDEEKTRSSWNGPLGRVTWRDPAIKEDQPGYDAAKDALNLQTTKTRDQIMAGDATAQLAALTAFETSLAQ